MCVCMHVYVCVCMHVYVCVHACVRMCVHACVCMCVHIVYACVQSVLQSPFSINCVVSILPTMMCNRFCPRTVANSPDSDNCEHLMMVWK